MPGSARSLWGWGCAAGRASSSRPAPCRAHAPVTPSTAAAACACRWGPCLSCASRCAAWAPSCPCQSPPSPGTPRLAPPQAAAAVLRPTAATALPAASRRRLLPRRKRRWRWPARISIGLTDPGRSLPPLQHQRQAQRVMTSRQPQRPSRQCRPPRGSRQLVRQRPPRPPSSCVACGSLWRAAAWWASWVPSGQVRLRSMGSPSSLPCRASPLCPSFLPLTGSWQAALGACHIGSP